MSLSPPPSASAALTSRDDRILLSTRILCAIIIPVLVVAFINLYFFPQLSGQRFSFAVHPDLQAVYVGSGYLGGAYLFLRALIGRRWHRVATGFPAVTAFTVTMLLVTLVSWGHFDLRHFAFQLWLVLYVITPVLVPLVWIRNRVTDPRTPEPDDVVVPTPVRRVVRALGCGLLVVAVVGFLFPQVLIASWAWALTPLAARLLTGWGMLLAVGNLVIAGESRWSGWRVAMESIALWHVLFLAGAVVYRNEFATGGLVNWFVLSAVAVLLLMAALYVGLEVRRRQLAALPQLQREDAKAAR